MKYTDFTIQMVRERLMTLSMSDRTPKKYRVPMFEAAAIISQLQAEIQRISEEQEA